MTTASRGAGYVPAWTFEDRLRKCRDLVGDNQRDWAERVGVTQKTVWATERGVTKPSRLLIRAWALAAGVDPVWLETGQAPETTPPAGVEPAGGDAECAIRDLNPEPADMWPLLLTA